MAADADSALVTLENGLFEILPTVWDEVPDAVECKVLDRALRLAPNSMWEGFVTIGGSYMDSQPCEFYTVEAVEKRASTEQANRETVERILSTLSEEEKRLMKEALSKQ